MDQLEKFLTESGMAKKIKVKSEIVLYRDDFSAKDILLMKKNGKFGPVARKSHICELEIDGKVLASGKIIKSKGGYYFKILKLKQGGDE